MDARRQLRWMDWVWCALPLGLALTGSLFGAICGVLAFVYNLRTFSSGADRRYQYMVAALSGVTAVIVYLVGGLILAALLIPNR